MVNYYELLEIPQNADKIAIEQAVRKNRRIWNNRANNPDVTIRAEAELHLKEISEAEKILLDESRRKEYDLQLKQAPKEATDNYLNNNQDWEDEFFQAYNREMNEYAAQIAQREISLHDRNGRAWFLYGEALRRAGELDQGIDALKRASLLISDDPGVYRQLGFAYADYEQYSEAYKAFKEASVKDPGNPEFHSLTANCLRVMGMIKEAIEEAKIAYSINSNDEQAKFEYFVALHEDAMKAISYNRSSGKHLIINKKQLDYINEILKTMSIIVPQNDDRCVRAMEELVQIVVDAESAKGGGFLKSSKPGYEYNYEISNADTRSTGIH